MPGKLQRRATNTRTELNDPSQTGNGIFKFAKLVLATNQIKEEGKMKPVRIAVALLFVLATSAAFAASAAQQSFEELKALNGSWEGKEANGNVVQVDYRVTSGGSALMSEIKGKEDMISMFNLDGDRLLLTHYCAAGNQPRMVASASPDGKTITFDFLDATNLATHDAGRMT